MKKIIAATKRKENKFGLIADMGNKAKPSIKDRIIEIKKPLFKMLIQTMRMVRHNIVERNTASPVKPHIL
jgi:hypothetical protein